MSLQNKKPVISVVMSVYNGEEYLESCLNSILNQTYSDFEFIIINDGSTDNTAKILDQYAKLDSRVSVHHEKENLKLVRSINKGCRLAKGEYIARMDADDICNSERFAIQVRYLDNHPEISVVGSWVQNIDNLGNALDIWKVPTDPAIIAWTLQFECCLAQPAIMMRRELLKSLDYYSVSALQCEDYDLWCRASAVTQLANIPEALVQRRIWQDSRCFTNSEQVEEFHLKYMKRTIERLQQSTVEHSVIKCLRETTKQQECLGNAQIIQNVKATIDRSLQIYRSKTNLSEQSIKTICLDAAKRIYYLAKCTKKINLWKSLPFYYATMLHQPKYFFKQIIRDSIFYKFIRSFQSAPGHST